MKYYFCVNYEYLNSLNEDGVRFIFDYINGAWLKALYRDDREISASFDTIQEALEYWPDHRYDGKRCSEYAWFGRDLQIAIKELL